MFRTQLSRKNEQQQQSSQPQWHILDSRFSPLALQSFGVCIIVSTYTFVIALSSIFRILCATITVALDTYRQHCGGQYGPTPHIERHVKSVPKMMNTPA